MNLILPFINHKAKGIKINEIKIARWTPKVSFKKRMNKENARLVKPITLNFLLVVKHVDIAIIGKAVHIANKDSGVDSIKLSLELLNSLQDIEGVVFNCGKITSTGARNIVCDKVTLECSLRSFYKIKRNKFYKFK